MKSRKQSVKSRAREKEKAKEDISDDEAVQDAVDDDDDDGRIKRYNTNIRTKSNTSGGDDRVCVQDSYYTNFHQGFSCAATKTNRRRPRIKLFL